MNIKELKEKLLEFNDEDEVVLEENHSDLLYGISDICIYDIKSTYIKLGENGQRKLVLSRD